MNGRVVLIMMGIFVLVGCVSSTTPMGLANPSVADAKVGQDCRILVGVGSMPDLTAMQAMHHGHITRLQRDEYRENTFLGVGKACVVAHGE